MRVRKVAGLVAVTLVVAGLVGVGIEWTSKRHSPRHLPPLPALPARVGRFVLGHPQDLESEYASVLQGMPASEKSIGFYDQDPPHGVWFALILADSRVIQPAVSADAFFHSLHPDDTLVNASEVDQGMARVMCATLSRDAISGVECDWQDSNVFGSWTPAAGQGVTLSQLRESALRILTAIQAES